MMRDSRGSSSSHLSTTATTLMLTWMMMQMSVVRSLQCATGWNSPTVLQEIPPEWINDGYCDCPLDGADEPGTNACAGSLAWPGISAHDGASSSDSGEKAR